MKLLDNAKSTADRLLSGARGKKVAHDEKAESDVAADSHVAGSRAGDDESEGEYVGRTSPQFDAETQQSGAEARSEAKRLAHE
ncbi:hypothetical protein [Mycobacterium deserti]|uniref:Antitoxin n=1 Tax=Mycobacterium deserti TaxID=2978347 RepID=A0ABT2MGG1_9MYCO|nr:hypothetical protein [Mycobacterium deserti]MCT7661347.1 hypothetical protein [Mycobacterium deserti]